jgi:zinc/manganese transport system substrate-binding protein
MFLGLPVFLAIFALLAATPSSDASEPLKVVASFSILGDFVRKVGGNRVDVVTLVGPNGDAHAYEPTPAAARDMAAADLVVVNGLGFEGWLDRLVEASGFEGPVAVASRGVEPLTMEGSEAHGHDPLDPHAWQSIANTEIYVANISEALCEVDREDCDEYQANATTYASELRNLNASIKADFAEIPTVRRVVITSHDAFGYFGRAYDIIFLAPQGVSTDSEASAADIASLIEQARREDVTALFVEDISDPRLIEQIARETGARSGGALYSDALSESHGPAGDYLSMMRHNASELLAAMQGS